MFLGLTVTGILLMFYYVPSVERAYLDIQNITTTVQFGQLMRNMHRWMAHAMVILVFLHMMRVFYTGAYKPPREFNWVVGVILLVLTFLLSFTGYLLPWDQLAFWAITVGSEIAGSAPVLGPKTASGCSAASKSALTPSSASTRSTSSACRCSPPSSWPSTSGASAATAVSPGRSRPGLHTRLREGNAWQPQS
ncbi:MAG: hypothetical protein KatS3mg063_0557 [Tepidiforma sp.]|nr:MAG: hypothetical protein KatS3mg063_0557 [Tepidiforma sp.]